MLSSSQRIEGSLMGMFIGDAMGAQVEFSSKTHIKKYFADGFSLKAGGTFNLIAGQITDDSEMAISLVRSFDGHEDYSKEDAKLWYQKWVKTHPFNIGITTFDALSCDTYNMSSEANGALMRCAPLALKFWQREDSYISQVAEEDCSITHPNKICVDSDKIYLVSLAHVLRGESVEELKEYLLHEYIPKNNIDPKVQEVVVRALDEEPSSYELSQGHVIIALQNALYCLFHSLSFTETIERTVLHGGDTDTNACIAGALLGAYHGIQEIPNDWKKAVLNCSPSTKILGCKNPRPDWLFTSGFKELISLLGA